MAASWEELEQKYSGGATSSASANDPWSALEQKYSAPAVTKTTEAAAPVAAKSSVDDLLPSDGLIGMLPTSVKAGIVATGREFDKLAKGAESGWLRLTGQDEALAKLRAGEKENDALYKPLEEAHPVATTIGGVAPYMAISPGSFAALPAAAVRTVAPKMGAGAAAKIGQSMVIDGVLQGAALGQLRQGDDTDAVTGGIGGAVGGALGRGMQKIISPNMGSLSAQQQNVVEAAKPLGGRMTPGQMTGNQTLQRIEAGLESNPITSFALRGVKDANQSATNRAAAKAIGETGASLDATVLANAEDRIGNVYKLVRTQKPVDLSSTTKPVMDAIDEARNLVMNPGVLDPSSHMPDPLIKKTISLLGNGSATQEELVSLSSQLGKRAKSQMTSQAGDRDLGSAMFTIKDAIDDALESSLSGKTQQLFSEARGQYRNLMQLYGRGVVNEQTGDVNAKVLANALASKDRKGFRLGENQSDLYNMARFARAFPSIVGDSGTATRMALPLMGGAVGGAYGLGSGDPADAVKYGLLGTAAPILSAKAYMYPAAAKYLGNDFLATGMPNNVLRRFSNGTATPMQGLLSW